MSEHTLPPPTVKRLERSSQRYIAGVCGGLGRYFDLNPAVFRLGFVVLTVLGGAGVLVYIAAVLVMPKEGEDRSVAEDILSNRRDHPVRLIALGLIAVAILSLLANAHSWPGQGAAWFLVVAGGLALLFSSRRGIATAILAVVSVIALAIAAALICAFAWFNVSLGDGVGRHSYTPTTAVSNYKLGIGRLNLDLTHVPAGSHVTARVGVGEIHILVPQNVRVTVNARARAGRIDALGQHDNGTHIHVVVGNGAQLTVDARIGGGHIDVERTQ